MVVKELLADLAGQTSRQFTLKRIAGGVVLYGLVKRGYLSKLWLLTKSKLIDVCSSSKVYPDYRISFKSCSVDQSVKHAPSVHSHYMAATDRCRGNMFIKVFASIIGAKVYSVSMSKSESDNTTGDHYYYDAKDLQFRSHVNIPIDTDLIQMVDVDYYLDLNSYLQGQNVLLNTFVPESASGSVMDGVFSINSSNEVVVHINGGAQYQHQIWDFETDHLIADHWWGSCLYLVEQRVIAPHKRLIFLNCVRKIYGPLAWFLNGFRLRRRQFIHNGLAHFTSIRGSGMDTQLIHNIALLDSSSSITISDASLQSCMLRCSFSKNPMLSDVERVLRANDEPNAVNAAPLVYKLILTGDSKKKYLLSSGVSGPKPDYQTLYPLVYEDGTPSVRCLMDKFIDGGFSPVRSYNNDRACVEGRVKKVANRITQYTPFVWMCLDEFVNFMIPDDVAGTLVPYDYEYMHSKMDRPSQRSLLQSVAHLMYLDDIWIVKAFQKSEFYGKITAPRNISTLPTDHNVRLGQYSYAFCEHIMKTKDWYAFGKTPSELEERIIELAALYNIIIPTDISKCDGSRGYVHYCLDQALMMRSFGREYHSEILRLLKKEAYAKGVTKFDYKYEADYNTLSGSSKTSWGNTVTNAFNNYLALRYELDCKEAWDSLGLFGGDDGLAVVVKPNILESTFGKVGMLLKAELCKPGDVVPFLGRLYLDPWTTAESIIDVPRQLMRIHATVTPANVPDNVVIYRKIEGYEVNDANTPVVKQWCKAMRNIYQPPSEQLREKYLNVTKLELNWWSRQGNFTRLINEDLAISVVAKRLDMTVSDLRKFMDQLEHMKDCSMISQFALTRDVKVEVPAVVDGQIIQGATSDHQQLVEQQAKKADTTQVPTSKAKDLGKKTPNKSQAPPKTSTFTDPPTGSRKQKLQTNNIKVCRFYAAYAPCPYGRKCKFGHG